MIYKTIYYNEEAQKIKFTQSTTTEVPVKFKYIGKMNQLELDVLVTVVTPTILTSSKFV